MLCSFLLRIENCPFMNVLLSQLMLIVRTLWDIHVCIFVQRTDVKRCKSLWKKWLIPGTDVMITIFCDFWQFSAKELAFLSKNNVMIKIEFIYVLSQKRQFFRWFFRRKYFKNHNIGPWTLSRLKFKLNSTFEHIESELCWQIYIYIVSNRHINILCQIKHSFPEEIFKLFQDHLKIVRYFALTYN
jgi:hypothetical protein